MDYPETITTERLQLRPLAADDAPELYETLLGDPEVARYLTWRPAASVAEATERLEQILEDQRDDESMTWVMTSLRELQPVGMFTVWTTEHGQELGYCLAADAWGQGLMTEAVRAVATRLLQSPGVARVWATCDVSNTSSVRVLEKAGFQREGLLRRCAIHPNLSPEPRDCLLYAAVADGHGNHTAVNPPTVFDSLQYGFSQAVEIHHGRRVLLSGQVAVDAQERTLHHDLEGQVSECLDNIDRLLHANGGSLANVVMLRLYLTETVQEQTAVVAHQLRKRFPSQPPASTWVVVSGLARDDWLIEIEAEAAI